MNRVLTPSLRVNKEIIDITSLNLCLENSSGKTEILIRGLIENSKNEKLLLINEGENSSRFNLSCEYKVSVPMAAGFNPYVPITYDLVLRNNSRYVISYDVGRRISQIGTTLLGFALSNDPGAIKSLSLDKDAFTKIINWVTESSLTGSIKRITMKEARHDNSIYKQVSLSSTSLESSDLFLELYESTPFVSNLGFETPFLNTTGRSLSCRLSHWGGLTVYSSDLLDVELFELIRKFEGLLD